MKASVYNQKKEEIGTVSLNDSVFKAEYSPKLLAQYVYSYLSNQRQSNAQAKDRKQVAGSGVKPWPQKGTGRARAGQRQSPLWKGGGVTFGPTNERNWKKAVPKTFKRASIRAALTEAAKNKKIFIVDKIDFKKKDQLTKQALAISKAFGTKKKITIISGEVEKDVINAFSNIPGARVIYVKDLNAYDIITGGTIILIQNSLEFIDQKWARTKAK